VEQDLWGLAAVIFLLLMEGVHPFSGIDSGSAEPGTIQQRVISGEFTYAPGSKLLPMRTAPGFETLHPELRQLFIRCFVDGHSTPNARPSASDWKRALSMAAKELRNCNVNKHHIHGAHLGDACPWCARVARGLNDSFPSASHSCFISYSTHDQEFAERLYADLQAKGVRCWFAPHDIMGGRKIHEQIDEAIRMHDKLLLILSEYSMASDWVGTEIAKARKREARENKKLLFPISITPYSEIEKWELFDDDRGKDSAREIREYYIPDFSGWERDSAGYTREFERLVAALKNSGRWPVAGGQ
jgi:hypothetical protein